MNKRLKLSCLSLFLALVICAKKLRKECNLLEMSVG